MSSPPMLLAFAAGTEQKLPHLRANILNAFMFKRQQQIQMHCGFVYSQEISYANVACDHYWR